MAFIVSFISPFISWLENTCKIIIDSRTDLCKTERMTEKSKQKKRYATAAEKYMQLRISRRSAPGQLAIEKIEEVATFSGLTMNDIASQAVAAGLPTIESKLREIHKAALEPA